MKFSQFIDVFVAALYNETVLTGRTHFQVSEIADKYTLPINLSWGERLFDDYTFSSRVDAERTIGPMKEQHISLSANGFRWVEDELGENVAHFLTQNGAHYEQPKNTGGPETALFDGDIFDPEIFDTGRSPEIPSFASANWTGISAKLSAEDKVKIGELSISLLAAVRQSDLEQRTKNTVLKHVEAVQTLLEAPEPPWKAIVDLLSHPALIAFLTAIQILQLIWGAAS